MPAELDKTKTEDSDLTTLLATQLRAAILGLENKQPEANLGVWSSFSFLIVLMNHQVNLKASLSGKLYLSLSRTSPRCFCLLFPTSGRSRRTLWMENTRRYGSCCQQLDPPQFNDAVADSRHLRGVDEAQHNAVPWRLTVSDYTFP